MKYNELLIVVGLLGLSSLSNCTEDWDFLIFSQRWPITACTEWEDHGKNNTCVFPEPLNLWTIHGIWPTKAGTKGPWNCNATWHFDESILQPIKLELIEYWTNIEGNTQLDSLWKHEWVKHGTCAAILPQLDNELKYFNQGLHWVQEFNMKDILPLKQIVPRSQGYSVQDVFDSVQSELTKAPIIQCIIDKYTKQSLISEIRICFDRTLNLIDCKAVKDFGDFDVIGNILTNCNVNKTIVYPDSVEPYTTTTKPTTHAPTTAITNTRTEPSLNLLYSTRENTAITDTTMESGLNLLYSTREKLLNLYKCIKLIMWYTF